jgi:hypothetical protein
MRQGMNSPSTSLALYILLTLTDARVRVTSWLVSPTPCRITTARLAPQAAEVVVILFAAVTLLPIHSWFALTLALTVALQTPRS